jgi:putative ABC transport system permease protein
LVLRQALGVKTRDILTQFLINAFTLSIVDGLPGIMLGILASFIIPCVEERATVVSQGEVLLAVFFPALVGISFG